MDKSVYSNCYYENLYIMEYKNIFMESLQRMEDLVYFFRNFNNIFLNFDIRKV